MASKSGLRNYQRFGIDAEVELSWTDARGAVLHSKGRCVDLSERGLGVFVKDEVPVRAYVNFRVQKIGFSGSGSVRSVVRRGIQFFWGIEFAGSLRLPRSFIDEHSARNGKG